jgi:hypothetical protein
VLSPLPGGSTTLSVTDRGRDGAVIFVNQSAANRFRGRLYVAAKIILESVGWRPDKQDRLPLFCREGFTDKGCISETISHSGCWLDDPQAKRDWSTTVGNPKMINYLAVVAIFPVPKALVIALPGLV